MINFKIKYYAKKHGKDIIRYGTYEPNNKKYRTWTDKKGNTIITYFDDNQKGYRNAVNPKWWYNITPKARFAND